MLLADIVVMQLSAPAGAGDTHHGAFALTAEKFAGEQIVTVDSVPTLRIFLRGNHLLQ